MIQKKIKVLKDHLLNTFFEEHSLIEGQVKRISFLTEGRFNDLLKLGNFALASRDEEEINPIPVILPKASEDTIVEVAQEITEDQSEPPIEVIDYRNTIKPRPTDTPDASEELTPEHETEGLPELEETPEEPPEEIISEFEEIPIAEQDTSKPSHQSFFDVHGENKPD